MTDIQWEWYQAHALFVYENNYSKNILITFSKENLISVGHTYIKQESGLMTNLFARTTY